MRWQTMTVLEVTPEVLARRKQEGEHIRRTLLTKGFPVDQVTAIVEATLTDEIWLNNQYQVAVRRRTGPGPFDPTGECVNGFPEESGEITWLSIKRRDREPQRDWRDLQHIKNDIVGPEAEAMEIYPAESRLMDTANQTHLFAIPLNQKISLGFTQRAVRGDKIPGLNGKQREPESVGLTDGHRRAKPGKNRNR